MLKSLYNRRNNTFYKRNIEKPLICRSLQTMTRKVKKYFLLSVMKCMLYWNKILKSIPKRNNNWIFLYLRFFSVVLRCFESRLVDSAEFYQNIIQIKYMRISDWDIKLDYLIQELCCIYQFHYFKVITK